MAKAGEVVSTREVRREIEGMSHGELIEDWIKTLDIDFFMTPTSDEGDRVTEIFSIAHFRTLVSTRLRLGDNPCADPWVIAKAWTEGGVVVTQERCKPNAARIPNICEYFGVACTDLNGFMAREEWVFR